VYTVPYTILYKDAISDIDKYTVNLTKHSSVNLPKYPSVLKSSWVYSEIYCTLYSSVYCRVFNTINIRQRLVAIRETVYSLLYIISYSHFKGKFTEVCSVKYTVYLSIPLMASVKSIV
jgi:hypothetical protein